MTQQLNALGAFEDLELFDSKGNIVYEFKADSDGYWNKYTYDSNGNELTFEDSDDYWHKYTYDSDGNELTFENSNGYWNKYTYDSNGKELTFENSNGIKRGFDIPEFTMEELATKLGHNFKIKK
jgi:hypothetical protein